MRMNKTAFLALLTSALLATSAYADSDGKRGPCDRQFDGPGFGIPNPEGLNSLPTHALGAIITGELDLDQMESRSSVEIDTRLEVTPHADSLVAEQLLQLLGLPGEEAAEIARRPLPESTEQLLPATDTKDGRGTPTGRRTNP